MPDHDRLTRKMEDIVGSSNVAPPSKLALYAVDGMSPQITVFPETVEQISDIMKIASCEDMSVFPRGGGTKMHLGAPPQRIDIVLSTLRLNRIIFHEVADLVASVQAGIVMDDLQAQLKEKGQCIPLDPPYCSKATIGGIIASNSSGPKRLLYGTARDLVIGTKVVRANGDIVNAGSRVVKNVTGYDLNKLYISSRGTLGIIVELNFKLYPLPESEGSLIAGFSSIEPALKSASEILSSQLIPSAIELLNSAASSGVSEQADISIKKGNFRTESRFDLVASVEGLKEAVQRQLSDISKIIETKDPLHIECIEGSEHEKLWDSVRNFGRKAEAEIPIICKASVLPSHVGDILRASEDISERYDTDIPAISHAGSGVLYIYLSELSAETDVVVEAIVELRRRASDSGGSLVVESAPTQIKEKIDVWGKMGENLDLMKLIKTKFDSKGILSPGRFVGGI